MISYFIVLALTITLLLPRSRRYFWYLIRSSANNLWDILVDYAPSKKNGKRSYPTFILAIIMVTLVAIFFATILLILGPAYSLIITLCFPEKADEEIEGEHNLTNWTKTRPAKTKEQIIADNLADIKATNAVSFFVKHDEASIEPDEREILFYSPFPAQEIENAISGHLEEIKEAFTQKGYRFVFLPDFNDSFDVQVEVSRINYFSPAIDNPQHPFVPLTYSDIKEALKIPPKVDAPCFIRCKRKNEEPMRFTFWMIDITQCGGILASVREYLKLVGDRRLYDIISDNEIRLANEEKPADDRFDADMYLIGKEIRERIEKLRAMGLSYLAIRKLIGDHPDKPSKLHIDKHNKLILTDFGNKEIKLEPLHKAVFFLFLRHPEGIFFKDLGDYREELGAIYREITGREDLAGIQDSINKLTDPLNNSINEKCARIKNAFVSEFREEVAQWYFIDGKKGEKKSIKLPRELVTWEIKD